MIIFGWSRYNCFISEKVAHYWLDHGKYIENYFLLFITLSWGKVINYATVLEMIMFQEKKNYQIEHFNPYFPTHFLCKKRYLALMSYFLVIKKKNINIYYIPNACKIDWFCFLVICLLHVVLRLISFWKYLQLPKSYLKESLSSVL